MPIKSPTKRVVAFFDGQNLYHAVKKAFDYSYPNFDAKRLAQAICDKKGWELTETRFYTGVPKIVDNRFWHNFWSAKLLKMKKRKNLFVYSRPLRYLNKRIKGPDGQFFHSLIGEEKGIDVRIAIDVIRLAYKNKYDVALLFSQDQDLSEVADEMRDIAKEKQRWIKIASAFPNNPGSNKKLNRGINKTDWIPFNKDIYDQCLDPRDYREK